MKKQTLDDDLQDKIEQLRMYLFDQGDMKVF